MPFTHLTSFLILGKEFTGALISANYELFSDTSALEDFGPWTSLSRLYISIYISFSLHFMIIIWPSFAIACIIMFIYLNFCRKKESGRRIYDLPPLPSEFENRGRRCILCPSCHWYKH